MNRILIASPIKQAPSILKLFLESLDELVINEFEVDFYFVDNNEEQESIDLLDQFQQKHSNTIIVKNISTESYQKNEYTHYWNDELVDKVAQMKDAIIEYALEASYDGLFLVDSDLVLSPDTLSRLEASDKDIISNIFWTRWQPDTEPLPQVWMMDEYSFSQIPSKKDEAQAQQETANFLEKMKVPGVYEVGGLGACTLISHKALEQGVRFKRLPNVSFWGEDRHFCIRAAALGISMYVDTRQPAYHIYRESDIEGVENYKRALKGEEAGGISISLCMIVKDEEPTIARCLASVQGIADEIVIVDTGSTDRTKEIAAQFNANIYDFAWIDDFGAARNYAFDQATKQYILWLDADDVILEEDRQALIRLKYELSFEIDSVMMNYNLAFDANGKPTTSLKRNRLVKRSKGFRWIGVVHEYLEVYGNIMQSEISITHKKEKTYSDRNLRIYKKRLELGESFKPRDLYYYGNELMDHLMFDEAAKQYEAFLATKQGWVEDQIAACQKLADCYSHLNELELQFRSLFRAMEFAPPRAEVCCRLGALFVEQDRINEAIFWYTTATQLEKPPVTGAFIIHAYWTWLPYLQLCVCYDRLGQYVKANECNEKALSFHPIHPSMLANQAYLAKRLEEVNQK
ncbi:glycosyltransferase family 2 protein [Paenibacillus turicensis]|uniref:tetratricopeptide repeat-containing glycosyltransferase family 2 protein n=1 Tax=Paenibacillus turicensis TaxID=160487 RepID=UPI003D26CA46